MTAYALTPEECASIIAHVDKLEPGEAVAWPVDAETYHADRTCVSRTQLEDLRESPGLFHGRYVTGEIDRHKETKALRIGSLTHLCVLEPDEWDRRVRTEPDVDKRTKEGKARMKEWREDLPCDALAVDPDEYELVLAMAAALHRHPRVAILFAAEGVNELSAIWREPTTKVLVRVRFDRLLQLAASKRAVVLDVKTADDASPRAFGDDAARKGYARQAALYSDVASALLGGVPIRYALAAVHKEQPYEVGLYELGRDELDLGRKQYRALLSDLVRRRAEDDWLAPWERGEQMLGLPGWAFREGEE